MCEPSKNTIFLFCPEDIELIADEISRCGKIAIMELENNLTELV